MRRSYRSRGEKRTPPDAAHPAPYQLLTTHTPLSLDRKRNPLLYQLPYRAALDPGRLERGAEDRVAGRGLECLVGAPEHSERNRLGLAVDANHVLDVDATGDAGLLQDRRILRP